ncbi:hypothetical protein [Ruegeria arenilitoris]|uniref:hypothetical protein n=1 Tax=Ruegeria arenilitoris TaxID=1173585 RepID=UPI00147C02AE|nr:hypothetical protein [Ruegeria arenilitoris]
MSSRDELTRSNKLRLTKLRNHLLAWYEAEGRTLPWRSPATSTFERICVEVLLQRTRAETVAAIYAVFFARFPSWSSLADAGIPELEEAFKPIGLWRRRAKSMKSLAEYAAARAGCFPDDPAELAKVPGVGQYVANAILLFQHGQPRPLVDVNMARVIERFVRPRVLADIRHDPWLQAAAHWLVRERPIKTNWATLDFAAKVCTARTPRCHCCPVSSRCDWLRRRALLQP